MVWQKCQTLQKHHRRFGEWNSGALVREIAQPLSAAGIDVYLVNSRHVKGVPGKKD